MGKLDKDVRNYKGALFLGGRCIVVSHYDISTHTALYLDVV